MKIYLKQFYKKKIFTKRKIKFKFKQKAYTVDGKSMYLSEELFE